MESIKRLKSQIAPILFSVAAVNWMVISLTGSFQIVIPILTIIISCIMFVCYNYIQQQKKMKFLLFVAFSVLYFILSQVASINEREILPLFLIPVYGFTSVIYYFTVIRYRIGVVFLTGLIPFLIYSSKSEKNLTLTFAIFVILFFVLYYERERKKSNFASEGGFYKNKWYYLSMFFCVCVVFISAMIIPKPDVIPKIIYLNTVLSDEIDTLGNSEQDYLPNVSRNIFNPVNAKTQSRIDSLSAPLSDRVLLVVEADEALYLKVRAWDKYENNSWKSGNRELIEYQPIEDIYRYQVKYDTLVSLLKRAKEEGEIPPLLSEHNELWDFDSDKRVKKTAVLTNTSQVFVSSLPVPVGILDADCKNRNEYINRYGMCAVRTFPLTYPWDFYRIEYISSKLALNSQEYRLMRILNKTIAEEILNPASYRTDKVNGTGFTLGYDEINVLGVAAAELSHVYENYMQLPQNISQRIYELAESITEGKQSDYDKAKAIEQYFHTSDFVYDLNPPRIPDGTEANDYFLFESGSGFCIHYASAMVVLARACGLPARYAEGYVADEIEYETGRYIVREKDAHAYPEVYIAGYGWMVFEPTVSNMAKSKWDLIIDRIRVTVEFLETSISKVINITPVWVRVLIIPFVIFTILFFIWVLRRLYIQAWIGKNLIMESDKAVYRIFGRIIKLLGVANLEMIKGETASQYERRICNKTGLDLSDFIQIFNKSKYAGIKPSINDVRVGILAYKDVVVFVKGRMGRFNFLKYFWLV
ncbi:MAG: transglutaminase domain-containing protein [Clostridium sp.]|nr:transglutaminase domain-containing protein [Clostridium sp.]